MAVVSIADHLDTSSATGRLMRTLLPNMAEFDRESIKERLDSGRTACARQAKYVGGFAPFGYRVLYGSWLANERWRRSCAASLSSELAGQPCRPLPRVTLPAAPQLPVVA